MLKRVAHVVAVTAGLLAAAPCEAQLLDLSTLKCKQFIDLPKDTAGAMTMWLDGYLTDEEDPAVIDLDKMKVRAERLAAYCGQNPEMTLMTAAENVMGK
jgi:acid stress chaperone HdeB